MAEDSQGVSASASEKTTAQRSPSRRTGRGNVTCGRLRTVAAPLFLARGYDRVSLDEIVRAAGGSKTNVYAFFGGKEGLFRAVIEGECREILAPLQQLDLDGLALEAGLSRLGKTLLDLVLSPRSVALFRLVIGETGRFPQLGAVWFAGGPATSQRAIADFLATLMPEREAAVLARLFHDMAVQEVLHRALFDTVATTQAREAAVKAATLAISALVETGRNRELV